MSRKYNRDNFDKRKKYEMIDHDDASELSVLGKFINWINLVYYDKNNKLVGKTRTRCIYNNFKNINKARDIDEKYILKKFDKERVIDTYGPATLREKALLQNIIDEFMNTYEPNPKVEITRCTPRKSKDNNKEEENKK